MMKYFTVPMFKLYWSFLRWSQLALLVAFLMLVNAVFSPLICLFLNKEGYLPFFLKVFQTDDNPAIGDESFHQKEMSWVDPFIANKLHITNTAIAGWLSRYIRGIFWAIRNPAYGIAAMLGFKVVKTDYKVELTGTPNVDVGVDEATGKKLYTLGSSFATMTDDNGKVYFEYRKVAMRKDGYVYFIQLGWNIAPPFVLGTTRNLCLYIRPKVAIV